MLRDCGNYGRIKLRHTFDEHAIHITYHFYDLDSGTCITDWCARDQDWGGETAITQRKGSGGEIPLALYAMTDPLRSVIYI